MLPKDIENNFTYHSPKQNQLTIYEQIRAKGKELALLINTLCPSCAESTLSIRQVEMAVFWANAAVARNPEMDNPLNLDRLSNQV